MPILRTGRDPCKFQATKIAPPKMSILLKSLKSTFSKERLHFASPPKNVLRRPQFSPVLTQKNTKNFKKKKTKIDGFPAGASPCFSLCLTQFWHHLIGHFKARKLKKTKKNKKKHDSQIASFHAGASLIFGNFMQPLFGVAGRVKNVL